MQAAFAAAVDPIFLATLQLESRIEQNAKLIVSDERATLVRRIDEAEAMLGNNIEWQAAKYALCAWIDDKLIQAPWLGKKAWSENCLEVKYFGERRAHEDFFRRAVDAATFTRKDALEVFYVAVILGFRGIYADPNAGYANEFKMSLRLPETIEAWCRDVARSLQLRQGRPEIPDNVQQRGSARPLAGRNALVTFSLISTLFIALATACFLYLFVLNNPNN